MRARAKPEVNECVLDEFENEYLSPGTTYLVVGFDDVYLRVLDDRGNPVLYPQFLFEIVDPTVPEDWVRREEADGTYYVDPPECAKPGFYEDYFDGRPEAVAMFQEVVRKLAG